MIPGKRSRDKPRTDGGAKFWYGHPVTTGPLLIYSYKTVRDGESISHVDSQYALNVKKRKWCDNEVSHKQLFD